jgi:hypothetical protein
VRNDAGFAVKNSLSIFLQLRGVAITVLVVNLPLFFTVKIRNQELNFTFVVVLRIDNRGSALGLRGLPLKLYFVRVQTSSAYRVDDVCSLTA